MKQVYTMPDIYYQQLEAKLRLYHPSDDFSMIKRAYQIAKEAHGSQMRKSGEPYIMHPLAVAHILAELELDIESITAGILHDVVEDTKYTKEELAAEFSEEVALLVDGVTKLGKIFYSSSDKEEIQAENYRKMFLAMAKDIRVILIKLADRLHNMRTLRHMPEHKQKEKARETLDIYAPLAHRLGISKIKAELEDLSLRYLHEDAYYDLVTKIARKRDERIRFVNRIVKDIQEQLELVDIHAKVEGRPKHFFSIYKKMINQHKTLDQIYDLFAVRAIVETVKDCYGVLGIVHEMFTPIPGRFKDYIAMPKPNMYQSLHTTVMGPEGEPFEIQIRTFEMHRTAEYGIAAHWKYKEGKTGKKNEGSEEEKLAWLRQILEWQQDMSDNKEFIHALKLDLNIFNDQVYAFTPQGDVIDLPRGSTPIDFAFHIHSAVGNKMVGARVNGKIVNFDYQIRNGDRIEIITSQNSKGPSRDWLNIVCSTQAKSKINQWFKKQFKQENIERGKELVEKYAKSKNIPLNDILQQRWMDIVQRKYGFVDWDSVYAAVGHGGLKEGQVVNRLYEEYKKSRHIEPTTDEEVLKKVEELGNKKIPKKSKNGIVIKGVSDVAVRLSKCCNPVPGDEIVGFITKGRGVSVHRTDCTNIIHATEDDRHRFIDAEWEVEADQPAAALYQTEIQIFCRDRAGLLVDVSSTLKDMQVPIRSLNARTTKDDHTTINITLEIHSVEQLEKIIGKLNNIPDVNRILRIVNG